MPTLDLRGIGIALITPFKEDGQVDYDKIAYLVDYLIEGCVDYIVALGTTSEAPTLSCEESIRVVDKVIESAKGRVPVVMGLGGNDTGALVEALNRLNNPGVQAILSVTPYYNKPTQEGLYMHYKTLSEATDLPIILYNVPSRTGVNMLPETTLRLARECENVVAIKEACGDINQVKEILIGAPKGFSVISGDDEMALSFIKEGGVGVISVLGNAIPSVFSNLIHLALKGDYVAAENLQSNLKVIYNLLFVDGNPAGVKALMTSMGLIENVLRLPLVKATDETFTSIKNEAVTMAQKLGALK